MSRRYELFVDCHSQTNLRISYTLFASMRTTP